MKVSFLNSNGEELAARLETPKTGSVKAYAIFAHCFTCSKNLNAVRNISRALIQAGFGVLRFDFTGLGDSEGDFKNTNFSTNINDLNSAANFLEKNYQSPQLLIGHSLGGAAVLFAANQIPSVEAIVTIGAPFGPDHVTHMFHGKMNEIQQTGKAQISIGGRPFEVKKQFIDDISSKNAAANLSQLKKALLIFHSPQDRIVEVDNASKIYVAANHPKSFVSLDGADHLLSDKEDSQYVGQVISSWASRYLSIEKEESLTTKNSDAPVSVTINGEDYTTHIYTQDHHLIADEPIELGGKNLGPDPFKLLLASLGSCTAITLRMYINRKKWDISQIKIDLSSSKEDEIFIINRTLSFQGSIDEKQLARLHEIADRCPVHKVLTQKIEIRDITI